MHEANKVSLMSELSFHALTPDSLQGRLIPGAEQLKGEVIED